MISFIKTHIFYLQLMSVLQGTIQNTLQGFCENLLQVKAAKVCIALKIIVFQLFCIRFYSLEGVIYLKEMTY